MLGFTKVDCGWHSETSWPLGLTGRVLDTVALKHLWILRIERNKRTFVAQLGLLGLTTLYFFSRDTRTLPRTGLVPNFWIQTIPYEIRGPYLKSVLCHKFRVLC